MDVGEIQRSWLLAEERHLVDRLVLRFYTILFQAHPETRVMFPMGMTTQRDRLVGALVRVVKNLEALDKVRPVLESLGRDHRRFGAVPAHYGAVRDALVESFSDMLGDEFTKEARASWNEGLDVVSSVMIAAAAEQDAAGIAPWWDARIVAVDTHPDQINVDLDASSPPLGYQFIEGDRLYCCVPDRPGLWTKATLESTWPDPRASLKIPVSGVDFAAFAVGRTRPGWFLRLGPPVGSPTATPEEEGHDVRSDTVSARMDT